MEIAAADSGGRTAEERPARQNGVLLSTFESCCHGLYRFILLRVGGDRDAADELLQETCCIAVGHARAPRDSDSCEAWLRGIARNLIRKHWRDRRRRAVLGSNGDPARPGFHGPAALQERGPLPPEAAAGAEARDRLVLAVTALSSAQQRLIAEFYFEGRSQADIAASLGTTEKTIETRLYRARQRLRAILNEDERMDGP